MTTARRLLIFLAALIAGTAESAPDGCEIRVLVPRPLADSVRWVPLREGDIVATPSALAIQASSHSANRAEISLSLPGRMRARETMALSEQTSERHIELPEASSFGAQLKTRCAGASSTIGFVTVPARQSASGRLQVPAPDPEILDALFVNAGDDGNTRGPSEQRIYRDYASAAALIVGEDRSLGTAVVIDRARGLLLTNWHVAKVPAGIHAVFKPDRGIEMAEAQAVRARVLARDDRRDLALIHATPVPDHVAQISLGELAQIEVGSDVHAIGHPKQMIWTYTRGIVSQIRPNFSWAYSRRERFRATVIQTQTPINPGNSGGPLIGEAGQLLGINTFTDSKADGLHYAVSVADIRDFLARIDDYRWSGDTPAAGRSRKPRKTAPKPDEIDDLDGDQYPDTRVLDIDRDGVPDVWIIDSDGDGKADLSAMDTDADGQPDLFRRIRGG